MEWVVNATPWPHYLQGTPRYTLYRRLGGPQGRSGRVRKISPRTGIRFPDTPARSESLYRHIYPGPCCSEVQKHITSNKENDVSSNTTNTKFHQSIRFWVNTLHFSKAHLSIVIAVTSRHNPKYLPNKNTYLSSPFLSNTRDRPKVTSLPAV
jgi:hypothetical protein